MPLLNQFWIQLDEVMDKPTVPMMILETNNQFYFGTGK